jgi:cytochrome oxidase Cu insertion factor (SCO1/SenC/PrrC family)
MKNRKKFFLIITAFIILFGGIYGGLKEWTGASSNITETNNEPSNSDIAKLMASLNILQLTEPVEPPNFTLMSVSEEQINLRQQRGKVVLLSFWATW